MREIMNALHQPGQNNTSVIYKDCLLALLRHPGLQKTMQEVSSSPTSPEAISLDHCYPVKEKPEGKIIVSLANNKKVQLKTKNNVHFLSQTGPLKITIFKKPPSSSSHGSMYAATTHSVAPSLLSPQPSRSCSNGEEAKLLPLPSIKIEKLDEEAPKEIQQCNGVHTKPFKAEVIKKEVMEFENVKVESKELPAVIETSPQQITTKKGQKKAPATNGNKAKPPTQTKGKRKKPQKYKGKRKKLKESKPEEDFDIPNQFKKKPTAPKKEIFDPFIRIEGRKESPYSVTIFNPSTSDETKPTKPKQNKETSTIVLRKKFCFRATSQNYDNINEDKTWRCVFCHTKNNIHGLGDLFGPYYRSANCDTAEDDEIWFHEACIVWSPGILLRDSQLVGLEDTIRDSLQYSCHRCKTTGATICCNKNKCQKIYHYHCSILEGCKLNADTLNLTCLHHSTLLQCT